MTIYEIFKRILFRFQHYHENIIINNILPTRYLKIYKALNFI